MPGDKVQVVLSVYDPRGTYSRHAGVVMASMFSNTKSPVCVHILHDETLNEDNRSKFSELAEKFGQELNFVDVREHIGKLRVDMDKITRGFSRGTLYRLFIQDLLPLDRVIYLDCDVVVELDIKELWDIRLGDCLAAAPLDDVARNTDIRSERKLFFFRYAGIDAKKYFAAGVLLLNLSKIRDSVNICDEASEFFLRYPDTLFSDQDFLNRVFQKSLLEIDRKFDYYGSEIDYSDMKGKIWHFTRKPWEMATGAPTDALYWRYYSMTPWCRDLLAEMTEALAGSSFTHFHSSDCLKALWKQMKRNLSPRRITPLYKLTVIWHDIVYRLKKFGI